MHILSANNITTGAPIIPDLLFDAGIGRYADERDSENIVIETLSQNIVIESGSKNSAIVSQENEVNEAA